MKSFNKKRLIISGILFILVIVLLLFINSGIVTYSKYETQVQSSNSITTALYLVNDEYARVNVKLPDVVPGNGQYKYTFSISNYKDDLHSDTNIKYRIHIRTTTNVNITYQLFNTADLDNTPNATNVIIDTSSSRDNDGTYFKHMYTAYNTMLYSENKTDYYTLLFTFPDGPNGYKNSIYSGIAELIEINVESSQKLDSDT